MKPKKIKFDLGKALVNGAAIYQAYQFGRALAILEPGGWTFYGVSLGGLFLGAIVNVTVAMASTRLPTVARSRKVWAIAAYAVLLAISPSLVMPALHLAITPEVGDTWRWILAFGYALAPDAAIALGGFVAGKSLVQLGSDAPKLLSEGSKSLSGRSGSLRGRSAKGSKMPAFVACRYEGAGCKRKGTQNAMNAHARACEFKPTIDDSLLIRQNAEKK